MELRKCIRNKFCVFSAIAVMICFALGYFLLASLDKIIHPSIEELYNSIYTVYTEFGMLIFPVLTLQMFSGDYKNKNILFYKLMGFDYKRYFFVKIVVCFLSLSLPTILGLFVISILYKDFTYLFAMLFCFESVLCFQVLLQCLWGFLFQSLMLGYMVNFGYWLISIMFSTAIPWLDLFARYDASNRVYKNVGNYFKTKSFVELNLVGNIGYTILLLVIVFSIVYFNRERWEKNGI